MECAALVRLGLDPDATAVALDYLLADRKADAGAGILALVVQPLEHHEDAFKVLRLDADAVVGHHDLALALPVDRRDVDARHRRGAKLERVADQVLEELRELHVVSLHYR